MNAPYEWVYEFGFHRVEQNQFLSYCSNLLKINYLHRSLYSRFARLAS